MLVQAEASEAKTELATAAGEGLREKAASLEAELAAAKGAAEAVAAAKEEAAAQLEAAAQALAAAEGKIASLSEMSKVCAAGLGALGLLASNPCAPRYFLCYPVEYRFTQSPATPVFLSPPSHVICFHPMGKRPLHDRVRCECWRGPEAGGSCAAGRGRGAACCREARRPGGSGGQGSGAARGAAGE